MRLAGRGEASTAVNPRWGLIVVDVAVEGACAPLHVLVQLVPRCCMQSVAASAGGGARGWDGTGRPRPAAEDYLIQA